MAARWLLSVLALGIFSLFAITAHAAAGINFSSDRDFAEININIKDQAQSNAEFVILSVTLTPMAQQRLEEVSRSALQQEMTISLDGKPISTAIVHSAMKNPHLKLNMSRQMARDVFPSLLATPVSSISLSGYAMPEWAQGKWVESPAADTPGIDATPGETVSIASKIINAITCKRVNHTVVDASDSMVELSIDRRNKCILNDVAVSKMILTRTTESGRIVISLFPTGSDVSDTPAKENTYRRQ
jgi:hypothetical protein